MDPVSEILAGVRLGGALFFNAEFSAPWGVYSSGDETMAAMLAPGAGHVVVYHLIVHGDADVTMPGGERHTIHPGEIVVFPHGDTHFLSNGATTEDPFLASEAIRLVKNRDLRLFQIGGGGEKTRIVCGFMACDPHMSRPILGSLPRLIKVNIRTDPSGRWLETAILHLVEEASSGAIGSEAMLAKLSEALFVDTLRRHIASLPETGTGWLAAARDPVIGRGLALLHARVAYPWTLESLAREIGISRSALAERFTRFLGEPPIAYLTRWRLQLAARNLTTTPKGVAEIAAEVGYESEAAFNRAFKRHFGQPPARYRRTARTPQPAAAA
jgi:AraC-like DNA-binding protein